MKSVVHSVCVGMYKCVCVCVCVCVCELLFSLALCYGVDYFFLRLQFKNESKLLILLRISSYTLNSFPENSPYFTNQ